MNFLMIIVKWLVALAARPEVQLILNGLWKVLSQEVSKNVLPAIIAAVEDANSKTDLTGTQKFDEVQAVVVAQFPSVEKSVVNMLIETALNGLKQQ